MSKQSIGSAQVYTARWEKVFERVLTPLEEFTQRQITGSLLLMLCAVVAMVTANTVWGGSYLHFLHEEFSLSLGVHRISMSLQHWINDGLMAFFFLVMGLELKRELLVGELADVRRASLPIIAACGGMLVPALIYAIFNPEGIAAAGWGIPMATDIAFAVGVLSLLGNRVPKSLVTFLIALAIVDDLGAVIVIAVFYTQQLNLFALLLSVLLTGVLIIFNLGGIRRVLPYMLVGALLWCAMLGSGVHATIAGVILAFCIPIRPKYNPEHFILRVRESAQQMQESLHNNPSILLNDELRGHVVMLEKRVELVQAPAQRLESALHVSVTYLIIPVFALANAAVPIVFANLAQELRDPVVLGVVGGLVVGKLVGITGATLLAIKTGKTALPDDLHMSHVVGMGLLGGIGFTMSIFVADLGFAEFPHELLMAKTGILLASIVAGVCGFLWLRFCTPRKVEDIGNS